MKISVIGPAIIDVLAGHVGPDIFSKKSNRVDNIRLSFGGNALNEAVTLSRLGAKTSLITKLGDDESGKRVLDFISENGLPTEKVIVEAGLKTAVSVVLIDESGERFFLTDPNSNLRKLDLGDIMPFIDEMGDIVCFPCMFTSPLLDIPKVAELFSLIKEKPGRTIVLDMTNAKNGETTDDMAGIFSQTDFFLPNREELISISKGKTPDEAAEQILGFGTKAVIVKCGSESTRVYTKNSVTTVPVFKEAHLCDTTGAGDCFGAGFIYGLYRGMDLINAVAFGNATASCTVEVMGATDGITSADEPTKRYQKLMNDLDIPSSLHPQGFDIPGQK